MTTLSNGNHLVPVLSFIYLLLFCILGYTSSYIGAILYTLQLNTSTNIGVISFIFSFRSIGFVFGSGAATYFLSKNTINTHKILSIIILISIIPLIWIIFIEDIISLYILITIQGFTMGYFETSLTTYLTLLYSDKLLIENALKNLHFYFGVGSFISPLLIQLAILSSSKPNQSSDFSYSFIFIAGLSIFPAFLLFFLPTPTKQSYDIDINEPLNMINSSPKTPTKTPTKIPNEILRFSPQRYKIATQSRIQMRELSPLKLSSPEQDIDTDDLEEFEVNSKYNTNNKETIESNNLLINSNNNNDALDQIQFMTFSQQLKNQNLYKRMLLTSCVTISLMYGGLEVIFGGFISNYFIEQFSMSPMYGRIMTTVYYGSACFGGWIYDKISKRLLTNSNLLLIGFIFCFIASGILILFSNKMFIVIIATSFCGLFMNGLFSGTYSLIEQSKYNLNLSGSKVGSIFMNGYCLGEILIPVLVAHWIQYQGIYYFVVTIFILCNFNLLLYIFIYFCHYQFHYILSRLMLNERHDL